MSLERYSGLRPDRKARQAARNVHKKYVSTARPHPNDAGVKNENALKRLMPYLAIFLFTQTLLRLSLLGRSLLDLEFSAISIAEVMFKGLWFDIGTASYCLLPIALYHLSLPAKYHGHKFDFIADKLLRFIFSFAMLFNFVAEHLFWTEFTTRFNFIAVDYLVYTQEVIGNIVESYPLHIIFPAIGLFALMISWYSLKIFPPSAYDKPRFTKRLTQMGTMIAAGVLFFFISSPDQATVKDNAEASEIAANGIYNLFSAFRNNEISYERFYTTMPEADINANARKLLQEPEAKFLHSDGDDLTRIIQSAGKEKHKNVIIVSMESMSAAYMESFGNKEGLTPNLDRLAKEGLFFSNLYATGTRTVRGLEALTLSIPPTPGQSILRRPGNENLFSLGFVFKDRGYDTKFIYGGYGYFDNMNAFFAGNGFDIIDRTNMTAEETEFANIWGICDEDMFRRAIREADKSYAEKKPFMYMIMTTSNHRPYTYPDNRIDIASHTGRNGGVKYADYSVGRLVEEAKNKPWFKDTVFIFVADHTAGAGGKAELDPIKYHIPMIFYSPDFIKPQNFGRLASQIDMAPTLLGLLDFSYYSKFFGTYLLHEDSKTQHTFISNYQKVALAKNGELTVLAPKKQVREYGWPDEEAVKPDQDNIFDAVTYYQSASMWKDRQSRIPTVIEHKAER